MNGIIEQAFATTQPEIVPRDIDSPVPRYLSQPLSILITDINQVNVKLADFGAGQSLLAHK